MSLVEQFFRDNLGEVKGLEEAELGGRGGCFRMQMLAPRSHDFPALAPGCPPAPPYGVMYKVHAGPVDIPGHGGRAGQRGQPEQRFHNCGIWRAGSMRSGQATLRPDLSN